MCMWIASSVEEDLTEYSLRLYREYNRISLTEATLMRNFSIYSKIS